MTTRRHALALIAALATASFALPGSATAGEMVPYSPEALTAALESGKPVLLDYYADWCGTCRAQERAIDALREANPEYDKAITFMRVDWDMHQGDPIARERDVVNRSTLLLLHGDKEIGRIEADTRKASIKALLDRGLKAGM